jgi:hypothetical protein
MCVYPVARVRRFTLEQKRTVLDASHSWFPRNLGLAAKLRTDRAFLIAFLIAFLVKTSHKYGDTKITRGKYSSHQQDPHRDRKFLELHEHKKREPNANPQTREHNDLSSRAKSPHRARQKKNTCRTSHCHGNKNNYRHAITTGTAQINL